MSVIQPAKCVFCTFARTSRTTPAAKRKFSTSPTQLARKPKFPSLRIDEVNLRKIEKNQEKDLSKFYTPQQIAAIEAANKVITQSTISKASGDVNPWSLDYYDELSQIDPVIDNPQKAPWTNIDETSRLKNDEELTQDLQNLMKNMPDDDQKAVEMWRKFDDNMRLTVGREEAERSPRSASAPDLPKLGDSSAKKQKQKKTGDPRDDVEPSPGLLRLMQMTGLDRKKIAALRVKTIITHRVVNQTRLGKIQKMYHLTVAGNGNGLLGIGEGKAEESDDARLQSQYRAIRNMMPIMRYENRTIFGDVDGKVSATEVELYARPPGFGLRCQQYIWEIARCAGIDDLAARVTRSRNPMNIVKATVAALLSQKDPEEIARARGRKLVDVRKVYYANAL